MSAYLGPTEQGCIVPAAAYDGVFEIFAKQLSAAAPPAPTGSGDPVSASLRHLYDSANDIFAAQFVKMLAHLCTNLGHAVHRSRWALPPHMHAGAESELLDLVHICQETIVGGTYADFDFACVTHPLEHVWTLVDPFLHSSNTSTSETHHTGASTIPAVTPAADPTLAEGLGHCTLPAVLMTRFALSPRLCALANIRMLFHSPGRSPDVIVPTGLNVQYAKVGSFGRGIYFADNVGKALTYFRSDWGCHADTRHADCKYLFACIVALGTTKVYADKASDVSLFREPEGFDSVVGTPRDSREFVVYNSSRVVISHVLYYQSTGFAPAPPVVPASAPAPPGKNAVLVPSELKSFFVDVIGRGQRLGRESEFRSTIADLLARRMSPEAFVTFLADALEGAPPADLITNLTQQLLRVKTPSSTTQLPRPRPEGLVPAAASGEAARLSGAGERLIVIPRCSTTTVPVSTPAPAPVPMVSDSSVGTDVHGSDSLAAVTSVVVSQTTAGQALTAPVAMDTSSSDHAAVTERSAITPCTAASASGSLDSIAPTAHSQELSLAKRMCS